MEPQQATDQQIYIASMKGSQVSLVGAIRSRKDTNLTPCTYVEQQNQQGNCGHPASDDSGQIVKNKHGRTGPLLFQREQDT